MRHPSDQDESEALSALIGLTYDAALDSSLWPEALRLVAHFVPGCLANIFSQDVIDSSGTHHFSWGDDVHYMKLFFDRFAATNPIIPPLLTRSPGDVVGIYDLVPEEEMKRTAMYNEYMKPQGYVDSIGCILSKSATYVAISAVIRHRRDGLVDDEARRRMGLIAPHIRRAILVGNVIQFSNVKSSTFSEVIDDFAAGVFLVDERGGLVHANASGRAMLDAAEPVKLVQDVLMVVDPSVDHVLREVFSAAKAGDQAVAARGIAVPLKGRTRELFLAHVLPLTSGVRLAAGSKTSVAALFVRKVRTDLSTAVDAAAQLYGLTPAEKRALRNLIELGDIADVANSLGTARSTVKKHLEHLFAKTGTRRQAELVRLITGFDSPARPAEPE
ncbi:MAG: helix-turn-helix transcriptional regulator [Methyloceanibacter sp.]|uniref:helix-turn-helix transcriptional regulator n=1 Tax=Methyloceanibacter sp. TaxID=1965321 RepID=UPI003D6CD146